jgi:hypothetical protein
MINVAVLHEGHGLQMESRASFKVFTHEIYHREDFQVGMTFIIANVRQQIEYLKHVSFDNVDLTWVDDENDTITCSSDEEVAEAYAFAAKQGLEYILEFRLKAPVHSSLLPPKLCSQCNRHITGTHFKCVFRENVVLCDLCEQREAPPYPMVKIYSGRVNIKVTTVVLNSDIDKLRTEITITKFKDSKDRLPMPVPALPKKFESKSVRNEREDSLENKCRKVDMADNLERMFSDTEASTESKDEYNPVTASRGKYKSELALRKSSLSSSSSSSSSSSAAAAAAAAAVAAARAASKNTSSDKKLTEKSRTATQTSLFATLNCNLHESLNILDPLKLGLSKDPYNGNILVDHFNLSSAIEASSRLLDNLADIIVPDEQVQAVM